MARAGAASDDPEGSAEHIHGGDPLRLLVVGVDDTYRTYLQAAMRRMDVGVSIETVYLPSRGHARAALASGGFDAVLADSRLPDGTGHQLLSEVGALAPGSRRILLASPAQEARVAAESVDAVWDKQAPGYELRGFLERLVTVQRLRKAGRGRS